MPVNFFGRKKDQAAPDDAAIVSSAVQEQATAQPPKDSDILPLEPEEPTPELPPETNEAEAALKEPPALLAPDPLDAAQEAPLAILSHLSLYYREDGVYLELLAPRPLPLHQMDAIITHLARKNIQSLDGAALQETLKSPGEEEALIAPPQEEQHYDEAYSLTIENNQMEAYLTLLPPEEGFGALLEVDPLINELREVHKLVHGLNGVAIIALIKNKRYNEKTLIAKGTPPIAGEDGRLIWHFNHQRASDASGLRQVAENEKVDYKDLDLFEQVQAGQLLVTKVPPTEGTPGKTVLGITVNAQNGKVYNLPVGKNTYVSEDKLHMHAKTGGRVDYINGYVEVSSCYVINGNVDVGTGNIDFNGDVLIHGNVLNDFKVKATGNIEVMGIVESAVLESEKDIVIRSGMQGSGRGMLTAGGGVFVRFVEYATVQASDIIVAESLLHSNVNCFGPVEVLNGRGSIVGGNVCAGTYIAARFIGNNSGRTTQLEVGVSPAHKAQLLEVEETINALQDAVNKLQRIVQLPPLKKEGARQKEARIEAMRRLLVQKKILDENMALRTRLKEQIEEMKDGQVHAIMTAYPGTTIHMAFERYTVQAPITYATFHIHEGSIRFTSCRFKQSAAKVKRIKKR
ncbi:FapA family protein [Christensenellaceae bacterium OttesenSCG-928-M15]|nr:FapA family protein [Christensenellaceae bacterium OttesenSCG-928-M15]